MDSDQGYVPSNRKTGRFALYQYDFATRTLVEVSASDDPGVYYLYQPESGRMTSIVTRNEKLKGARRAPTRYVHYRARDGLQIPAYLTLPVGCVPKGLPLIIMPHGGPYGVRDSLGYDPEVQFLANRGYVVLQPNYRGSPSYGAEFYKKGEGQWGRTMQDDLDDGMDWLVKGGIVDPQRVCVVGGSYGGYAALWGATRNPERYRCAASLAGVTDVGKPFRCQINLLANPYRKNWRQVVQGDFGFDLDSIAPLSQVESLKVPVPVAHGDEDSVVPDKQATLHVSALKKHDKVHEFYS